MKDWQGDFEALGVNVAALSYDDSETLAEFAETQDIHYALLSDRGSKHIGALGIRNEQYEQGHFAHGVAHPGVFFVDAAGVVRLKRAVPGYRERPSLDELLNAVRTEAAARRTEAAARRTEAAARRTEAAARDSPNSAAPP